MNTIKDLKALLANLPDDTEITFLDNSGRILDVDGQFYDPECNIVRVMTSDDSEVTKFCQHIINFFTPLDKCFNFEEVYVHFPEHTIQELSSTLASECKTKQHAKNAADFVVEFSKWVFERRFVEYNEEDLLS